MLIGLAIGIAVLILLVLKTKVQAFLALIICTIIVGVVGGMPLVNITLEDGKTFGIVNSITSGFGGTLGSIGIIIGFGVMMGQIFEVTGAAKRMAWFRGTGANCEGDLQSNEEICHCTWRVTGCGPCNHPLPGSADTRSSGRMRDLRSGRRKVHSSDNRACASDVNCLYRICENGTG